MVGRYVPLSWETGLYRLYDADMRLLYVGISISPEGRMEEHARTKPWWSDVAYRSVEWFENGVLAREIETAVISSERPLHNYVDNKIPPQRVELGSDGDLRAAADHFQETRRQADQARATLYRMVVDARRAGMSRAEIIRTTGLNGQTVDTAIWNAKQQAAKKGVPSDSSESAA
jgi:hypothetical protein